MARRSIALRPRLQDKRGLPAPEPPPSFGPVFRRYRPPVAPFGLWELPGGFGITVLR